MMPGQESLATLLVEFVRDLARARAEIAGLREVAGARGDYLAWLQAEVLRARSWTILDLVSAWHAELDRRAEGRRKVAA
jgi:hypothetical protein